MSAHHRWGWKNKKLTCNLCGVDQTDFNLNQTCPKAVKFDSTPTGKSTIPVPRSPTPPPPPTRPPTSEQFRPRPIEVIRVEPGKSLPDYFQPHGGGIFTAVVPPVVSVYKNWRGVTERREFIPIGTWHGTTEYHPEPQWFLKGYDTERQAIRDYALKDFVTLDAADE